MGGMMVCTSGHTEPSSPMGWPVSIGIREVLVRFQVRAFLLFLPFHFALHFPFLTPTARSTNIASYLYKQKINIRISLNERT